MLQILSLLVFGKLQDHYDRYHAWQWAVAYAGFTALWTLAATASLSGMLIGSLAVWLYAWGYFALLRRFADNLMMWLLVWVSGALLPFALTMKLLA